MTDTARIKRNISKMIEQGAPEAEIDSYVAAEGTTPEALRGVEADTSLVGALQHGFSGIASGTGSTLKHFAGAPEAGAVAKDMGNQIARDGYQSAGSEFVKNLDPLSAKSWGENAHLIPRAAVEQLPGLGVDLMSAALGATALGKLGKAAKLAGGFAGQAASMASRTLGPEAEGRAAYRTGDPNAEPTPEDKAYAAASTLGQAVLNQYGLNRFLSPRTIGNVGFKGVAKSALGVGEKALAEGATEAAQSAVSQAGQTINTPKGLNIDFNQALAEGVLGSAGGGMFAAPRGAKDAVHSVRMRDLGGFETEAAAVTNRMAEKVGGDIGDLKGAKNAFSAVRDTQTDLNNEISQAAKAQPLSVEASSAVRRAKLGRELSSADIAAVDSAGPQLSDLVKQAHALSVLKRLGVFDTGSQSFSGGLTQRAKRFVKRHPWLTASAAGVTGGSAGASVDGLMGAIPGMITTAAGVAGAYGLMRGVEHAGGFANPAHTFATRFYDPSVPMRQSPPQTIRSPTPSVPRVAQTQPAQPWGPAPTKEDVKSQARQARTLQKILKEAEKAQARAADKQAKAESGLDQDIRNMVMGEARIRKMREAAEAAAATQAPPIQPQTQEEGHAWSIPPRMQRGPVENLPDVVEPVRAWQKAKPQFSSVDPFGAYPKAPWAYDSPEKAADAVFEMEVNAGRNIYNPEGYWNGIAKRIDAIDNAISEFAKSIDKADIPATEEIMERFKGVRSFANAKDFRDIMKMTMPQYAEKIDQIFSDDWIAHVWSKGNG